MEISSLISHARDLSTRPRSNRFIPWNSISQILTQRAHQTPHKVFLIYYDRDGNRSELTYLEFFKKVQQRVALLRKIGINPGEKVATYSGNFPETVLTYFSCWCYGVTVVPLNVGEDDQHLRFIISNSHARIIFTRPELQDQIRQLLSSGSETIDVPFIVEPIEVSDDESQEVSRRWENIVNITGPDTEALIVYTSGTTGNPKGVRLDHYNLLVDAWALAQWHKITSQSRMMCVLPIHHVNGTVVTILTPLVAGSSFVLNEKFSVQTFFPRLANEEVEVVSVVPTLLAFLLEANASTDKLNLKLRHIICGAGPLTVELATRFEERYRIPIAHG
ncbi:MAG: class I adenylate-forming enzyme family protein, partial [bacterium]